MGLETGKNPYGNKAKKKAPKVIIPKNNTAASESTNTDSSAKVQVKHKTNYTQNKEDIDIRDGLKVKHNGRTFATGKTTKPKIDPVDIVGGAPKGAAVAGANIIGRAMVKVGYKAAMIGGKKVTKKMIGIDKEQELNNGGKAKKKAPKVKKLRQGAADVSFPDDEEKASADKDKSDASAEGEGGLSVAEVGKIAGSGLSSLGQVLAPAFDKPTGNVVSSATGAAGTGLAIGASTGTPLGAAIGAGAGLLLGTTTALISNAKEKQAEEKRKERIKEQTNMILRDLKLDSTDVFSTEESVYNNARIKGNNVVGLPGGTQKMFAEGGKVTGPGTAKSDSIPVKLKEHSVVVPAENGAAAEELRKWVFGNPEKKMKSGGKVPVKLSDGEHVFTPEEKKAIDAKVVGMGGNPQVMWDKLIPNPDPGNELKDGTKKLTTADTTGTGSVARDVVMDVVKTAHPGFATQAEEDEAMAEMIKRRRALPKTQQPRLLAEGTKDLKSSEIEADRKKLPSSLFKKKYGISFYDYDNGKKPEVKKIVAPPEKKIYIPVGASRGGLKGGFEYTQKQVDEAIKKHEGNKQKKESYKNSLYNDVFNVTKEFKVAADEVTKKYVSKYRQYGITGPEIFKMSKKQQDELGLPQDVVLEYYNEWAPINKKYESGISTQLNVKKSLEQAPDRIITAKKIADGYLSSVGKTGTKDVPNGEKVNFSNSQKEWTGGAGKIPLKKDDSALPTVTLPDQAAAEKAAKAATAKGKGSGTGSDKGSIVAKQAASALGIKPTMAPERSVEEDLATLPESQGGTLPNKMAVANEGQDEMPENLKPDKFVIDAADILSMGQVLTGIMSANKERPLDKVNPIFASRVAAAIGNAEKAKAEAEYGFSYEQNKAFDSAIENNRRQAMADVVQTTSAAGGTTSALRTISQDKNRAHLDKIMQDQNLKMAKQQMANQTAAQADQMSGALAANTRQIFQDDKDAYWQEAGAAAELMNAGLTNFFNNQQQKKVDKERAKREGNIDKSIGLYLEQKGKG